MQAAELKDNVCGAKVTKMPKIETIYCAKCGAANQGYERENGAAMVLQPNGKYEDSNIVGCAGCQKYPIGVDEVWTDQDEQELKKLRRRKAKHLRDQNRQRKYSPRLCSSISEKTSEKP